MKKEKVFEMMKSEIRILGIDDAAFSFADEKCKIIGVIVRGPNYLECVLSSQVVVDGFDATEKIIHMVNNDKYKYQIKTILLDGISFAGFNVFDINEIYEKTQTPLITVTRDKPDMSKMKESLKKNFKDWQKRWEIISKGELFEIKTKHNPIYVKFVGMTLSEAKEIIKISTIRGVIPEPIRMAHLIASGIVRGESYGKA